MGKKRGRSTSPPVRVQISRPSERLSATTNQTETTSHVHIAVDTAGRRPSVRTSHVHRPVEVVDLSGLLAEEREDDEVVDAEFDTFSSETVPSSAFDVNGGVVEDPDEGAEVTDAEESEVPKENELETDRYDELRPVIRQWRHLKMLKRSGRGHDPAGVAATRMGECAVECPACPHPGKNLPDGWQDAPENVLSVRMTLISRQIILTKCYRWLFAFLVTIDANFRLKLKDRGLKVDPPLGDGWSHMIKTGPYKAYIDRYGHQIEPPVCDSELRAADHVTSRTSTAFKASGVAGVFCGRHGLVLKNGLGDLQKGERQANIDFVVFSALFGIIILALTLSYDICCQWSKNLAKRVKQLPSAMQPSPAILLQAKRVLPKMHLHNHGESCQLNFNLNFIRHSAQSNFEDPERYWAWKNPISMSTREMTDGARYETICDCAATYNWFKISTFDVRLLKAIKTAVHMAKKSNNAFEKLNSTFPDEVVDSWTEMVAKWDKDQSQKNPYEEPVPTVTLASVMYALASEEMQESQQGIAPLHETSASRFLQRGLDLEDQQRKLYALMKEKKSTLLRKADLLEKRNALQHRIDTWRGIQAFYMPEVQHLRAEDNSSTQAYAEEENLYLPSGLPDAYRLSPGVSALLKKELRLRIGQADDALHEIRRLLRISSTVLEFKKGQHMASQRITTRTRQLILNFRAKSDAVAARYVAAYNALNTLDPGGDWTTSFKPLNTAVDLHLPRREEDDLVAENRRELSWIWLVPRSEDAQRRVATADEVSDSMRVEWAKSYARRDRWAEEVQLVCEEMRRIIHYFHWKHEWWLRRINRRTDASADVRCKVDTTWPGGIGWYVVVATWQGLLRWRERERVAERERVRQIRSGGGSASGSARVAERQEPGARGGWRSGKWRERMREGGGAASAGSACGKVAERQVPGARAGRWRSGRWRERVQWRSGKCRERVREGGGAAGSGGRDPSTDGTMTRDGLILYALLAGGDYHNGVENCGKATALTAVKYGLGASLHAAILAPDIQIALEAWREHLQEVLALDPDGIAGNRRPTAAANINSILPSPEVFSAYATPLCSPQARSPTSEPSLTLPDLPRITRLCEELFEWATPGTTPKKVSEHIWPGVILRMILADIIMTDSLPDLASRHIAPVIPRVLRKRNTHGIAEFKAVFPTTSLSQEALGMDMLEVWIPSVVFETWITGRVSPQLLRAPLPAISLPSSPSPSYLRQLSVSSETDSLFSRDHDTSTAFAQNVTTPPPPYQRRDPDAIIDLTGSTPPPAPTIVSGAVIDLTGPPSPISVPRELVGVVIDLTMATWPPTLTRNLQQLPSPITPSHPSPKSSSFPATPEHFQPPQLVPLKGFVHEVLRRSRTSGTVLQTALCYLEAIRAKVPELVEKEKNGTSIQGEVDISHQIVQGDLEAEEWRELVLDSVMADFIHLDAAVDHDAMPMMKAPEQQVAVHPVSVPAPTLTTAGLKSHVA
ncbi:hypothetical protein HWV62_20588 [Athelia sp. TMB]|nr:hypothetical protein HWV62_20588 [Athelia sp. TMB]